jgi:hypothetical protein
MGTKYKKKQGNEVLGGGYEIDSRFEYEAGDDEAGGFLTGGVGG